MYHPRPAMKYLSKFTREFTAFCGWRLALKRSGESFVRYFSALELGGMDQAEAEARRMRDALLDDLEREPDAVAEIFARYRKAAPDLPEGLSLPVVGKSAGIPLSCSLRCNRETALLFAETARQWGIDYVSTFRAALYLFFAWSRLRKESSPGIRDLIDHLMSQGEAAGLPPFSQLFASPSKKKKNK